MGRKLVAKQPENRDETIREIQRVTSEHYIAERQLCMPYCCYTLWRRHIFPVYGCSYSDFTRYLKVRFPDHSPDADCLLPTPRHYEAETIRKIRAINSYMKLHYRPGQKPKITIKSVWREFVKTHFTIDYAGFSVYSKMDADEIERAQADTL